MQRRMLFRISKIQIFESKSQLNFTTPYNCICCSEYQRYKFLKANHNQPNSGNSGNMLFRISKIQIFESKSQLSVLSGFDGFCCSEYQRYKFLKAIHNKYCISISYTALRNGLEPLYTKEVLFLLL